MIWLAWGIVNVAAAIVQCVVFWNVWFYDADVLGMPWIILWAGGMIISLTYLATYEWFAP